MMTWDQIQRLSDTELMRRHEERCRLHKYDTSEYSMMLAREVRYRKRHGKFGGLAIDKVKGPSLQLRQER